MKKLSVIMLVLLLVSMVTYGATGHWEDDGDYPATWMTTGKLGVGTNNPSNKLEVYHGTVGSSKVLRVGNNVDAAGEYVGIELSAGGHIAQIAGIQVTGYFSPSELGFYTQPNSQSNIQEAMRIDCDGNVGIGTTNPQSELAVNGTITTKKVKVTLDGWSDFVFADNYNLMPLDKLERHIKVNNSLPGIPTEKEVLENGVSLGDMQAKLLEKVEELTLYVIEQNKKIYELEGKIAILEADK